MPVQHIYLARHGQTYANEQEVSQGLHSELDETGHVQATLLANRTKKMSFSRLLCSPFLRAQQTAEYIAGVKGLVVETHDFLHEVKNASSVVGTPRAGEAYQAYFSARMASFERNDPDFMYEDEESFREVKQRVHHALSYFATTEEDMFVVTHGHFLRYLVASVLTRDTFTPALWATLGFTTNVTNTGITVLQRQTTGTDWKLHMFNDIAHFADN